MQRGDSRGKDGCVVFVTIIYSYESTVCFVSFVNKLVGQSVKLLF